MRLLFVCLGNICRSPAAEAIMSQLLENVGQSDTICDSAGTSSFHQGEKPDKRMRAALEARGYRYRSVSRPVTPQDFYDFDLILAMDRQNQADLKRMCPESHLAQKIKLMCEFRQDKSVTEVPDPYYGGTEGFDHVIDLLEEACRGLWAFLQSRRH